METYNKWLIHMLNLGLIMEKKIFLLLLRHNQTFTDIIGVTDISLLGVPQKETWKVRTNLHSVWDIRI